MDTIPFFFPRFENTGRASCRGTPKNEPNSTTHTPAKQRIYTFPRTNKTSIASEPDARDRAPPSIPSRLLSPPTCVATLRPFPKRHLCSVLFCSVPPNPFLLASHSPPTGHCSHAPAPIRDSSIIADSPARLLPGRTPLETTCHSPTRHSPVAWPPVICSLHYCTDSIVVVVIITTTLVLIAAPKHVVLVRVGAEPAACLALPFQPPW